MVRFMILTFAVLGWAFYELSGGADFAPPEVVPVPRIAHVEPDPLPGAMSATPAPEVAPAALEAAPGTLVVTAASEFEPDMRPAVAPPDPEPVAEAAPEPAAEVREVVGSRVNMRGGPGTDHAVVTVLNRGEPTEIVEIDGRWARIRSGEAEGWMALSMLSDPI